MGKRLRSIGEFFGLMQPETFGDSGFRKGTDINGIGGYGYGTSNDHIIPTDSGENISVGPAMSVSASIARRNLIVRNCAKLPLRVCDRDTNEPIRMQPDWAGPMPVPGMTNWAWKSAIFDGLARWGWNAVRVTNHDVARFPQRAWPLYNRYTRLNEIIDSRGIDHADSRIEVTYTPTAGRGDPTTNRYIEWLGPYDPLTEHPKWSDRLVGIIRMLDDGSDGGVNPTAEAADVLGVALAAQRNAALAFGTGGSGEQILMTELSNADDSLEEFIEDFRDYRADPASRHHPFVTSRRFDELRLRQSQHEQQVLPSREFSVREIARLDLIPLTVFGNDTGSYGTGTLIARNVLHMMTLEPYITCVESFLTAYMVPSDQYVEFDVSSFLRGSEVEQWAALGRSIRDGLFTPNQALAMLGLPPVEGGDVLMPGKRRKGERDSGTEERRASKGSGDTD